MQISATVQLTQELITCKSVTPNDAGCQDIIAARLSILGFKIIRLNFGETKNLLAIRSNGSPHLCFAGHTDVVPSGDVRLWESDPFTPTLKDSNLYGRGVADMKGGIAAMLVALEKFIRHYPDHKGTFSMLITSDEEGPAHDGTQRVLANLPDDFPKIDYCIVGEPTSDSILGDIIKNGSRGSLNATVTFTGKQGHVGYAHLANNPIHQVLAALRELTQVTWDQGAAPFPPTSLQVTNVHAGVGAENVIPEELNCKFNLRFAPTSTVEHMQETITKILDTQPLPYTIDWRTSGLPFASPPGNLTNAATAAIQKVKHITPTISAGGGTSDARFIIKLGCEVIELGLSYRTIHMVNEHVPCADLDDLMHIYFEILEQLYP